MLINSKDFKLPNFFSYFTNKPRIPGHTPSRDTAVLINKRFIHHQVLIKILLITNTSVYI